MNFGFVYKNIQRKRLKRGKKPVASPVSGIWYEKDVRTH